MKILTIICKDNDFYGYIQILTHKTEQKKETQHIPSLLIYKSKIFYNPITDFMRLGISIFSIIPVNLSAPGPKE